MNTLPNAKTIYVSTDSSNNIILQIHYSDGKWKEFTVLPDDVTEIDLTRQVLTITTF